jgi:hypothetical protein
MADRKEPPPTLSVSDAPKVVEQLDCAGREIEQWDVYGEPTGIHYSPHALNRTHQNKDWLEPTEGDRLSG